MIKTKTQSNCKEVNSKLSNLRKNSFERLSDKNKQDKELLFLDDPTSEVDDSDIEHFDNSKSTLKDYVYYNINELKGNSNNATTECTKQDDNSLKFNNVLNFIKSPEQVTSNADDELNMLRSRTCSIFSIIQLNLQKKRSLNLRRFTNN